MDEEWHIGDKLLFLEVLVLSGGHNEPVGGISEGCGADPLVVQIVQVQFVTVAQRFSGHKRDGPENRLVSRHGLVILGSRQVFSVLYVRDVSGVC